MTIDHDNISKIIREKIHSKQIKMRPRAYFVTGAVLLGAGGAFALIASAFFVGVSFFRIRIHAPFSYLGAGQAGIQAFASTFPWIPIALAVLAAGIGLLIMKKFDFSYRHAFIGVSVGFCAVILMLGAVVDASELPNGAEQTPLIGALSGIDYDTPALVTGTITNISTDEVTITTPDQIEHKVQLEEKPSVSPSNPVKKGDWARVLGEQENGEFKATRIYHSKNTPYGVPPSQIKDDERDEDKENPNTNEKKDDSENENKNTNSEDESED